MACRLLSSVEYREVLILMFIMRLGADHPAFIPKEDTKCILEISNCHMFNILTVIFKNIILKATCCMII